jgi:hypothetical protein
LLSNDIGIAKASFYTKNIALFRPFYLTVDKEREQRPAIRAKHARTTESLGFFFFFQLLHQNPEEERRHRYPRNSVVDLSA